MGVRYIDAPLYIMSHCKQVGHANMMSDEWAEYAQSTYNISSDSLRTCSGSILSLVKCFGVW